MRFIFPLFLTLSVSAAENLLSRIPLHFEPLPDGGYGTTAGKLSLRVSPNEARLLTRGAAPVRMRFANSRPGATVEPLDRLPGVSNYYLGNDPRKWREKVPHYARVRVRGVYEGIDAVFHGDGRELEYDFVVAPGANPDRIQLTFDGASRIHVDESGALVLSTKAGDLKQRRPRVYQSVDGRAVEIAGSYRVRGTRVGFDLEKYDRSKPLVIDPVLSYGTLIGESTELGNGIAVDPTGATVIAGNYLAGVFGPGIPLVNPVDTTATAGEGIVIKVNPAGTALLYSTFLGGGSNDTLYDAVLDASGNAYVGGYTEASDFPTKSPLQGTSGGGSDAVIAKLDPSGALVFSSYLGGNGNDQVNGLAINATGFYAIGSTNSTNFPGASGTLGGYDVFVSKFPLSGSQLTFTATLGSPASDGAGGIAVDSAGAAYITGTAHGQLPATAGAFQSTSGGDSDAFAAKLNVAGSSWTYVTHIGGAGADSGAAIAIDASGKAYIAGSTFSGNFPVRNPLDSTLGQSGQAPASDAFVTVVNAAGTDLTFSTYFGGVNNDEASSIALLPDGSFVAAGNTDSPDFPVLSAWKSLLEARDAFVAKFTPGGALVYSTLFGSPQGQGGYNVDALYGMAVDSNSAVYITGRSGQSLPTATPSGIAPMVSPGAFDTTHTGLWNVFVAKLIDGPPPVDVTFAANPPGPVITVDGRKAVPPVTLKWLPGTTHLIEADSPQVVNNTGYTFANWSIGGAARQTITAPAASTTLTVNYSTVACSFSATPGLVSFGFDGGSSQSDVTVNCPFTASANAAWIVLKQPPYQSTGTYTVSYSILPNPGAARTATIQLGSASFVVSQSASTGALPAPASILFGSFIGGQGHLIWGPVPGAAGYDIRVVTIPSTTGNPARVVYAGYVAAGGVTETIMELPADLYTALVRACGPGAVSDTNCGPPKVSPQFNLFAATPIGETVSFGNPTPGQTLTASTNQFTWTPSQPGGFPYTYDVTLTDAQRGTTELQIRTPTPDTIFTTRSSTDYRLAVRVCWVECAEPTEVRFQIQIPPLSSSPPTGLVAKDPTNQLLELSWNPVTNADLYRVQVVQAGAGPGGGALTVAAKQVSTTSVALPVPPGPASVIVNACNGDGCGPQSAPLAINPTGGWSLPFIASPMPVIVADGPVIFISWNRIPGDTGSNTDYRLYVGDLSRNGPALDVVTKNNYYAAYVRAEGRRYDAFVSYQQGGSTVFGPTSGFMVRGTSAPAPLITSPTHNSTARGRIRLSWAPIPGAVRYEYYVARLGQAAGSGPVVRGMSPGTFVETAFPLVNGAPTAYQAIVRACPAANQFQCRFDSDQGWGPWSSAVTGTTTFTVVP